MQCMIWSLTKMGHANSDVPFSLPKLMDMHKQLQNATKRMKWFLGRNGLMTKDPSSKLWLDYWLFMHCYNAVLVTYSREWSDALCIDSWGVWTKEVTKAQEQAVNAKRRHDNVQAFIENENTPLLVGAGAVVFSVPFLITLFLQAQEEQQILL